MSFKLFVGGITNDLDELTLAQLLGPYGDIETMKIVRDKKTGIGKGYAFVEFADADQAAAVAAALHGTEFRGRVLDVKLAEAPKPEPAPLRYERLSRSNEPERKLRPRRPRV